jgi:hypothetical protein
MTFPHRISSQLLTVALIVWGRTAVGLSLQKDEDNMRRSSLGIDGGFVRAAHKEGWFKVIAGKSVVAFRRKENSTRASTGSL